MRLYVLEMAAHNSQNKSLGFLQLLSKQWAKTAIVRCRISGIHSPSPFNTPLKHSFQNGSRRVVNAEDSKYTKLKY